MVRESMVTFTATSTTGGLSASDNLIVRQQASPGLTFRIDENRLEFPAEGGTLSATIDVSTIEGVTASSDITNQGADVWITGITQNTFVSLSITVAANSTNMARQSTVTFTATGTPGGLSATDNLIIRQEAADGVTLMLGEDRLEFPPEGGMLSVTMDVSTSGNVTAANPDITNQGAADWVTEITQNALVSLSITVEPNPTNAVRESTITFTATSTTGGLSGTDNLVIRQEATPMPAVVVSPDTIRTSAEWSTHNANVTLVGGANAFTISPTGLWFDTSPLTTQGPRTINISENTTDSARVGMIIFIPIAGTLTGDEVIRDTIVIIQGAYENANVVSLSTNHINVGPEATSVNVGLGVFRDVPSNMPIRIYTVGGGPGASAEELAEGLPPFISSTTVLPTQDVLTLHITANTLSTPRVVELALTTFDDNPTAFTFFTLIQAGATPTGPGLTLSSSRYVANPIATTITTTIGLLGGATGWTSSGKPSWITVADNGMAGELSIMLTANNATTATARQGTITLTPTGGSGTRTNVEIEVIQRSGRTLTRAEARPSVYPTPHEILNAPAAGITDREITLNYADGATNWAAHLNMTLTDMGTLVSAPSDWTLSRTSGNATQTTTNLSVEANTSDAPRVLSLAFTGSLQMGEGEMMTTTSGPPRFLRIHQLGVAPTTPTVRLGRVSIDPVRAGLDISSVDVGSDSSLVFVNVGLSGGATAYTATITGTGDAPAFVSIPSSARTAGILVLKIAQNMPTSSNMADARTDTIAFAPTGGSGEATRDTLIINQQAGVSRLTAALLNSSGRAFPLANIQGSALAFNRNVRLDLGQGGATRHVVRGADNRTWGGERWINVPTVGSGGNIVVRVLENPSAEDRRDTLYFQPIGGVGMKIEDSIIVIQNGRPRITLSPSSLDVPAAGCQV